MAIEWVNVVNAIVNRTIPKAVAPIACDKVGANYYQVVKLDVGGDGVSVPVVGGIPVVVTLGEITRADTEVDVLVSSTLILASNPNRKGGWIQNNTNQLLFLHHDEAAVVDEGVRLLAYNTHSLVSPAGVFKGAIYGIHGGSGGKRVLVVEET